MSQEHVLSLEEERQKKEKDKIIQYAESKKEVEKDLIEQQWLNISFQKKRQSEMHWTQLEKNWQI
jgi:hypothetical protein